MLHLVLLSVPLVLSPRVSRFFSQSVSAVAALKVLVGEVWRACAAYIASQRHENWALYKEHYDDGGISGGTMDCPVLWRILSDIEHNRVDIVVVYKVDRLT